MSHHTVTASVDRVTHIANQVKEPPHKRGTSTGHNNYRNSDKLQSMKAGEGQADLINIVEQKEEVINE